MHVLYVTPYFTVSSRQFLASLSEQPGIRLAVAAQEDLAVLPEALRRRVSRFERVDSAMRGADVVAAARRVAAADGRLDRIVGPMEQVQESVAEAREALDVPGMRLRQALNFRDKNRMKDLMRKAGLPVARFRQAGHVDEALAFARECGFPVVVKPPAGAASQETFRAHDEETLRAAFEASSRAGGGAALLEEFVTGSEHSYDAFVVDGKVRWYSLSDYLPNCLDAMRNPWIQWCVLLRRDYEAADIAEAGQRMLNALGLENGMCHGEWFRRKDGSVVISEAGARPGGAMLTTLISRAHDVDCVGAYARLVTAGQYDPFPPRKYAAGAAFVRGQGSGRVRAVHGVEQVRRDLGAMITDERLPAPGHEKSRSYEGEGVLCVRHADTKTVEDALQHIIKTVRVELG